MAGEILIEEGDPAQVVQAAATRRNADLVVIGRSAREGVLGRLRPNAYSIVRDAPCPVVSVKGYGQSECGRRFYAYQSDSVVRWLAAAWEECCLRATMTSGQRLHSMSR